jgi:hypothetical protein
MKLLRSFISNFIFNVLYHVLKTCLFLVFFFEFLFYVIKFTFFFNNILFVKKPGVYMCMPIMSAFSTYTIFHHNTFLFFRVRKSTSIMATLIRTSRANCRKITIFNFYFVKFNLFSCIGEIPVIFYGLLAIL